jgi:hypothetical protein
LPPPRNPIVEFAQKVSEPPLLVNVQHWLYVDSVQSVFVLQRRSVWVPVHEVETIVVGQALAAVQATTGVPVQLGTVPPSMSIVLQHTSPAAVPVQSDG